MIQQRLAWYRGNKLMTESLYKTLFYEQITSTKQEAQHGDI